MSALIDDLYRATWKAAAIPGCDRPGLLRQDLHAAHRFALDDEMSAFLADLKAAMFFDGDRRKPANLTERLRDQARMMARLPFPITWIEYKLPQMAARARELWGQLPDDLEELCTIAGMLLRLEAEALITCHFLFRVERELDVSGLMTSRASPLVCHPVALGWSTAEGDSAVRFALSKYYGKPLDQRKLEQGFRKGEEPVDMIWALLATINDIPVETHTVAAKGFVANGSYRRGLDHSTITLRVADDVDRRKLARKIVAAARMRAHAVRGHWRKDHWRPGERIWVKDHERGDRALGFVTHDYVVKRGEEKTA